MGKYSCPVCLDNCKTNCIFCETCKLWVHFRCQNIDEPERKLWQNTKMGYICTQCRSTDDGSFDYLMGLERLKQCGSKGMKSLVDGVERELLMISTVPVDSSIHTDFQNHQQDPVANAILSDYHATTKTALKSTGDGDCLFNSFSTYLVGDESRSIELRYRCCIEMVATREKIKRHRMYPRLKWLSPDYEQDCLECPKPGAYASVWNMIALSNLLNVKVESVYPAVNGSKHYAFLSLNKEFRPTFVDPEKKTISIMWTNINPPHKSGFVKKKKLEWFPNHFVPLVCIQTERDCANLIPNYVLEREQLSVPSVTRSPPLESVFSSPNSFRNLEVEESAMEANDSPPPQKMESEGGLPTAPGVLRTDNNFHTGTECSKPDLSTIAEESFTDIQSPTFHEMDGSSPPLQKMESEGGLPTTPGVLRTDWNSSPPPQKMESEGGLPTTPGVLRTDWNSPTATDISYTDESSPPHDAETDDFVPGPLKRFMDLNTTLNVFKGPHTVLDEVPVGRKDGMYFLINNATNVNKRNSGKRSEFWDDCGPWTNGASPASAFIEANGKLLSLVKRQGIYCMEKRINKKKEFVPVEPQPADSEIVWVHRYYQTLKASPAGPEQFKKRVTWIEKEPILVPEVPENVALVEYIGTFPGRQYHGIVKHVKQNVKYIRTKASVRTELKTQLQHQGVKDVERKNNQTNTSDYDKQRNEKQLRNIKYSIKNPTQSSSNIADHVISVEEMTKTHDFVKSVKHINGLQHPVITLYTDQQIKDLKRFCCIEKDGCVIGMDKTYNLGEFHVTPTVYKDMSVLRRSTMDNPICFGPTFIHQSSTTKTYSTFLHDIADNLTDVELSNITIGTDEELAFKNAIKRCLPGSTHVLCTRHIKQNSNKYMEDIVGYPLKTRTEILNSIYGKDGLLEKTDIDTHSRRLDTIRLNIDEKDLSVGDKKFRTYFDTKLYPLLKQHIIEPVQRGKISPTWTNNNSESANHVLKTATQWKLKDLPKFIKILYEIVQGELEEKCRAIRDMGNFRLVDKFQHHLVDIDHWARFSEEQREKRVKKFLTDFGKSNPNLVISTDGTRTTMKTPTGGRKPHQAKRSRAERSRTPSGTPVAKRRL